MQLRNKPFFIAATLLAAFAMSACGNEQTSKAVTLTTGNGGNGTGNGGGSGTTVSGPAPLTVTVETSWESDDTDLTNWTATTPTNPCAVPSSVPGSVNALQTCTVYIPEGQLYFSKLHFSAATDSVNDCAIMIFSPYYYKQSNSATFTQYGSTSTIACDGSTLPIPAGCYNGPATLLTGFPDINGTYYLTQQSLSNSFAVIPSANSFDTATAPRFTNDWTVNNLELSKRGTALGSGSTPPMTGDSYVANSMHDYVFSCKDQWNQLMYQMTVIISDDPTASGFLPPPTYSPSAQRSLWYQYN